MKILLLYSHDDTRMGYQDSKRLLDTFVGDTEDECKQKVEKKYTRSFKEVIANWCSYEIRDAN